MAESSAGSPRVVIAHPGQQYAHQTAFALEEGRMLERFYTTVWYRPNRFPSLFLSFLPRALRAPATRELRKRHFPRLDDARVDAYPLTKAAGYVARRLVGGADIETRNFREHRRFDRWVARRVKHMPLDACIGYETSALETFRACARRGIPRVLDLASEHWTLQEEMFRRGGVDTSSLHISVATLSEMRRVKDEELALADVILTPSTYAEASLLRAGIPAKKIRRIPYGVDLTRFHQKEAYRARGRFRILFVGTRFAARKGLVYLLEAYRQLAIPESALALVGPLPPDDTILAPYRALFTRYPFLHHEELARLYQDADVFVLPSLLDSFGIVAVEAMACGTPVIVSDHTGAKDLVEEGKNGFVVPVANVDALERTLRYIWTHRDMLPALGSEARRVAEQYSWERYRERVRTVVKEVTMRL